MFFVYILQSKYDGSFYIGYTHNLDKRISQHNDGLSRYTSKKMPWRLVYFEMFNTNSLAIKRELQLKSWKNRSKYIALIEGKFQNQL